MGMSEDGETSRIRQNFRDLCMDLNMDSGTEEDAWEAFERISHSYTLEGDSLHWLACSLYVSCRKSTVPTVSGQEDVEGNCVSLTRLLRTAKLSLIDFFKKMKKWAQMASLLQRFRDKVDRLERNFSVSTVVFSKYEPIFKEIFIRPTLPLSPGYSATSDNPPKAAKGRKQKRTTVTVNEVFCFCWTTFVQVKGNFATITDDLVNSYHLLLCCVDWIFGNVLLSNRKDLLNPDFAGLPANYKLREYRPPTEPPCIIDLLCDKHQGLPKEAKGIKEHYWKPYIRKHFDKKILVGSSENLMKVLDMESFDKNSKSLNGIYEEYVLNIGDFDERIFLGEDSVAELGTPAASMSSNNIDSITEKIKTKKLPLEEVFEPRPLQQPTPLTNRQYLSAKGDVFSPLSTAARTVYRLQTLLANKDAGPSDELLRMFSNCPINPANTIVECIGEIGRVFCRKYSQSSSENPDENPSINLNFVRRSQNLAMKLYYLTLENIIVSELRNPLIPDESKLSVANMIFQQEELHRSLFAICLEVVIFSYNSQKVFPWIIEVLEIPAFSFYKVVEIVNRVVKGLSRDVVKHLNYVEEMILDGLVWKSDSPLWDVIKKYGKIPTVEEVLLPRQFNQESNDISSSLSSTTTATTTTNNNNNNTAVISSAPGVGNNCYNASIMLISTAGTASPLTRPIHETFTSPVPVKRRLFDTGPPVVSGSAATVVAVASPAAVMTNSNDIHIPIRAKTVVSRQNLITVQLSPTKRRNEEKIDSLPGVPPPKIATKPKKTGSVPIFFRRVYALASVRLRDLCDRLCIDQLLCNQIWTCIEHVFLHFIDLLKDRHLDQIIMCCIYAICRVTEKHRSFQDIMKYYRQQPQANSYVYRSVLLESRANPSGLNEQTNHVTTRSGQSSTAATSARDERRLRRERDSELNMIRSSSTLPLPQPSSQPPTPTRVAGTGLSFPFEDRGDIVMFYNTIFIPLIKSFAFKFHTDSSKEKDSDPIILSPLPVIRDQTMSPRRVSSNVYVSPINGPRGGAVAKVTNSNTPLNGPNNCLLYCFNMSPSKDLRAINDMIRNCRGGKDNDGANSSNSNSATRLNISNQSGDTRTFRRRLHQVVTERHAANGSP